MPFWEGIRKRHFSFFLYLYSSVEYCVIFEWFYVIALCPITVHLHRLSLIEKKNEFANKIIILNKNLIDNQFNGLTGYGKTLELFEISGDNKVFHKADAYIDEEKGTVVVTCKYVAEPKTVRYAFKDFVKAELFGTGGLPVSSFRTDDWD